MAAARAYRASVVGVPAAKLALIEATLQPDTGVPELIEIRGKCPRCGHEIHKQIHQQGWGLDPASGGGETLRAKLDTAISDDTLRGEMIELLKRHSPPGARDATVQCNCAHEHKADKEGCGAWFSLRVEWRPDDDGRLQTTLSGGPPVTGLDMADAKERDQLAHTELTRLRGAAVNWRTGLGALLVLIPTLVVVKGTDTVNDLSNTDKAIVGALIAVGTVLAVVAALCALRAAYGPLSRSDLADDLTAARESEVDTTISLLYATGIMTVIAAAALAAAIGYTWAAPTVTPANFSVTRNNSRVECGILAGTTQKAVKVKKSDTTIPIPFTDIKGTSFTTKC